MRVSLLYLSHAAWARRIVTGWRLSRLAASRFVAGDTLEGALPAVKALNERGLFVTLDHLGEDVTTLEAAASAAEDYLHLLDRIDELGLKATISLKLTQLGLRLDEAACGRAMERIASRAVEHGNFVRIDMEDSSLTSQTLEVYRSLGDELRTRVGVVIQSYLYRSEEDTRALLERGARIRLVKGAYNEGPEVAYPSKADVDASFDRIASQLIGAAVGRGCEASAPDGRRPPLAAIATHDPERIGHAKARAAEAGLPPEALEFQMLYGIAADLQAALAEAGYPVRVYVPYGTEWYPYLMRRLAERPANLWFFLSHLFRG